MLKITAISCVLAAAMSLFLFSLKYDVQRLEDDLSRINRQMIADQEAIHVLEAEWSHLNNPNRLRDLAQRHLGLQPLAPHQIGTLAGLPAPSDRMQPASIGGRSQ